ncbi:MAG: hypothetical protein U0796_20995 [Gemmatales bacterium]
MPTINFMVSNLLVRDRCSAYAGFDPTNPLILQFTDTGWRFTAWRATWWSNYCFYFIILFSISGIMLYTTEWTWEKLLLAFVVTTCIPIPLAHASTIKRELIYDRAQQTWTNHDEKQHSKIPIGAIHSIKVEERASFEMNSVPLYYSARIEFFDGEGDLHFFRIGNYGLQPQAANLVRWLREQALAVAPFMKMEEAG